MALGMTRNRVTGTHEPFGFSLALSKGWVLRLTVFVLISWSNWISTLRWVSLNSWGFHSELLLIALGLVCNPFAKVCWFRPLLHTGKCCVCAPKAFSWLVSSQRLQYQLLGYCWCPQHCLLGYCWLLLMCTRGRCNCQWESWKPKTLRLMGEMEPWNLLVVHSPCNSEAPVLGLAGHRISQVDTRSLVNLKKIPVKWHTL